MANNGGFTLIPVASPMDRRTATDLGMIMTRSSKRPMLSSTVDSTADVAGMQGAYDFGAKLSPLEFRLECAMITRDYRELQAVADQAAEFLLDTAGRPRQLELIFDSKPGRKYTVRYSGSLDFDRNMGVGTITLPFIAFDPFSYQTELSTDVLDWDSEMSMDNERITFDYEPPIFTLEGPQTVEVLNYGAFEVWPVIQIIGSFTTLFVKAGSRTLVCGEAVASGTLTIDCHRMQAKLGATNKNNKVSGQFIKLQPGTNSVEIGGTGLNCSVSFIFRAKYT